jgi:hypothetical protein
LADLYKSDPQFASYIDSMGGFDVSGAPRASVDVSGAPRASIVSGAARTAAGVVQNNNIGSANFTPPDLPSSSLAQLEQNRRTEAYNILTSELGFKPYEAKALIINNSADRLLDVINTNRQARQSKIRGEQPLFRATGGMIPSTSGIDTVPAMLSGGEFIMNRSAVQNIGAGNLQSMNSGTQSVLTDEASKEMNEKLLSKLDELIEVSSGGGDITINVSGSGNETTTGANNQDASSMKQQLAREVKDAVLKVLDEQKRLGGRLRR